MRVAFGQKGNTEGEQPLEAAESSPRMLKSLFLVGLAGAQQWLLLVAATASGYRNGNFDLVFFLPLYFGYAITFAVAMAVSEIAQEKDLYRDGIFGVLAGVVFSFLAMVFLLLSWSQESQLQIFLFILAGAQLGLSACLLAAPWMYAGSQIFDEESPSSFVFLAFIFCVLAAFAQIFGLSLIVLVSNGALAILSATCWLIAVKRFAVETPAEENTSEQETAAHQDNISKGKGIARTALAFASIWLALVMMLSQFLSSQNTEASSYMWVFGMIGVGLVAIIFGVAHLAHKQLDPLFVFRFVPVPMIFAFFPMDVGSSPSNNYAIAVSTIALWFFLTLSVSALQESSSIIRRPSHELIAGAECGSCLGLVAGYLIGLFHEYVDFYYFGSVTAILAMILSFLGSNVIISRDYFAGLCPPETPKEKSPSSNDADREKRIAEVADAYGLTKREAEVMGILAQGYDLKRVQDELYISEGTATTHRRHVYQKLDVHSRSELIDLISNFDSDK